MDLEIDGRIALVTGADSGIGGATAAELLREGAVVVLTSPDAEALERAAQELARSGGQVHALAADLRDATAVAALRDQVHQDVGEVDILVHAAGVTGPHGKFHELSEHAWQETLDIDLLGAVMDARADQRGTDRAEAIASFLAEERPFMELGRRGEAEEVAAVITFLCSERASFVNGSNYRVDAGSVATI